MNSETDANDTAIPATIDRDTTTVVPVLWDQRKTADYLDVSTKWLERDRWQGATIPYVKIGRAVRYRAVDVLNYVNRNSVGAA